MNELLTFLWSRQWVKNCVLVTLIVLGQGWSLYMLDKYPTVTSDDITYSQPAWSLLTEHKISCIAVPPMGGFDQSSLVQHGRIFMAFKALIFKCFGMSVFTSRLPSFLAGLGILWLTYSIAQRIYCLGLVTALFLSFSSPFLVATHSGRPDSMVCLFFMSALWLVMK